MGRRLKISYVRLEKTIGLTISQSLKFRLFKLFIAHAVSEKSDLQSLERILGFRVLIQLFLFSIDG
jgi:hypothetical protein